MKICKHMLLIFIWASISFIGFGGVKAQDFKTPSSLSLSEGALVVGKDTLVRISSPFGPLTPQERVKFLKDKLHHLIRSGFTDTLQLREEDYGIDIVAGNEVLITVTPKDAHQAGMSSLQLAQIWQNNLQILLTEGRYSLKIKELLFGVFFTLLVSGILLLILKALSRGFQWIYRNLENWKQAKIKPIRIQTLELLSVERLSNILTAVTKFSRLGLTIVLFYFFLTLIFSFFPFTKGIAKTLSETLLTLLQTIATTLLGYLPNLIFIIVIIVLTHFAIKLIRLIFSGIEQGAITIPGFYTEWAIPTYRVVRLLIIIFALIVAFPYLPGSSSPAFRGISIFVGVLLSLGSTSAIGNMVSGLILTYMRPFRVGDRVKIADTVGDVIEKTLLVTRIRTIKNVDITIPNSMILGSHITNYSSSASHIGLIIHTTVTIGYDAPWRKVHQLLIKAALQTPGILHEPKPFVLQTQLNDFFVSYEINGYTDQPNSMAQIYSDLHQNIQDTFNQAGVEIMSPHYTALRDGTPSTIPPDASS